MNDLAAIFATSFLQQVGSSMNSRARNRSSYRYHMLTAFLSHGFFVTSLGVLIDGLEDEPLLALFYVLGGGAGSLLGTWISVQIEQYVGARVN